MNSNIVNYRKPYHSMISLLSDEGVRECCEKIYKQTNVQLYNSMISAANYFNETEIINFDERFNNTFRVFKDFLNSSVPKRVCSSLALSWSPELVAATPAVFQFLLILAKIMNKVGNQYGFYQWITSQVIPKKWTSINSSQNKILTILSLVRYSGNKCYAFITPDPMLKIFKITKEGLVLVCSGACTSVVVKKGKKQVKVYNQESLVASFTVKNAEYADNWGRALNATDPPPFIYTFLMNKGSTAHPAFRCATYHALASIDGLLLRALLSKDCFPDDVSEQIIDSIIPVMSNLNRVHTLVQTLYIDFLERSIKEMDSYFTNVNNLTRFFKKYNTLYGEEYLKNLLCMIATYIDEKGELYINQELEIKEKDVETLINTIVKFILSSMDKVPPQIRLVCSIIREYSPVKVQTTNMVIKLISEYFLGSYLLPAFSAIKNYTKDTEIQNFDRIDLVLGIVTEIFKFVFPSKARHHMYFLDERLRRHIFPRIRRFIYALGDFDKMPPFKGYTQEELEICVDKIITNVCNHYDNFSTIFHELESPNSAYGNILGWNLAVLIKNCFKHAFDPDTPVSSTPLSINDMSSIVRNNSKSNPGKINEDFYHLDDADDKVYKKDVLQLQPENSRDVHEEQSKASPPIQNEKHISNPSNKGQNVTPSVSFNKGDASNDGKPDLNTPTDLKYKDPISTPNNEKQQSPEVKKSQLSVDQDLFVMNAASKQSDDNNGQKIGDNPTTTLINNQKDTDHGDIQKQANNDIVHRNAALPLQPDQKANGNQTEAPNNPSNHGMNINLNIGMDPSQIQQYLSQNEQNKNQANIAPQFNQMNQNQPYGYNNTHPYTMSQLNQIYPNMPPEYLALYTQYLAQRMAQGGIKSAVKNAPVKRNVAAKKRTPVRSASADPKAKTASKKTSAKKATVKKNAPVKAGTKSNQKPAAKKATAKGRKTTTKAPGTKSAKK